MSKLDEKKEYITTLRVYLGFILAIVLSLGTGVSKLYLASEINILFYIGIALIFLSIVFFIRINKTLHKEIRKLRGL
ncbi:MAG: hypothetical protein ABGW74_07195 [Campylobacterales bacterium]